MLCLERGKESGMIDEGKKMDTKIFLPLFGLLPTKGGKINFGGAYNENVSTLLWTENDRYVSFLFN